MISPPSFVAKFNIKEIFRMGIGKNYLLCSEIVFNSEGNTTFSFENGIAKIIEQILRWDDGFNSLTYNGKYTETDSLLKQGLAYSIACILQWCKGDY